MSILRKRIKDGWYKDVEPIQTTIPLENIDFESLIERGWVRAKDEHGHPFNIRIEDSGMAFYQIFNFGVGDIPGED
jgi:hypothetical protein